MNLLHDVTKTNTDRKYAVLYGSSLFVYAVGDRVKRLLNMPVVLVSTVCTIRTDREPIYDPSQIVDEFFQASLSHKQTLSPTEKLYSRSINQFHEPYSSNDL